jgi:hypothetical protein
VRLIRSKGVGIFFVTQTPKDVPGDVLAQLGSRVQHQLRAHTPDDARALRATVSTYPISGYDLAQVLQSLAIGEAIVTVMNEKGAPSPVAWTRLPAPQSSMSPTPPERQAATVAASPLLAEYGMPADPTSARDILAQRASAAQTSAAQADAEARQAPAPEAAGVRSTTIDRQLAKMQRDAAAQAARQSKAQAAAEARAARVQRRRDERLRADTVNAGLKIARLVVGKLFGSTRR